MNKMKGQKDTRFPKVVYGQMGIFPLGRQGRLNFRENIFVGKHGILLLRD